MIRRIELYFIRNLELFRYKQMKEDYEKAEIAFALLENILNKHREIDEQQS